MTPARLPVAPHSRDAEERILGCLLCFYRPELVHLIQAAGLKWHDFAWPSHQAVYRAVLRMHRDGEWVDAVTVARFLECRRREDGDWLAAVGGRARLECLVAAASASGLREMARMVAEDGRWRRWLHETFTALDAVYARDDAAFRAAVERVRGDVLPGELRVLEGGREGMAA